jgi:ribosomal protein S27E
MIATSLDKALDYAKAHAMPRVIEVQCPQCKETVYAFTDDEKHEHMAWYEKIKRDRNQRYVSCKKCGYGMLAVGQGDFIFKTHQVSPKSDL